MDFLNDLLLKTFLPFEWKAIAVFVIVSVIWFFMEYKNRKTGTAWSWKYWRTDNAPNVIISIAFFIWYNISADVIKSGAIVFIVISVNQLLSWLLGLNDKFFKLFKKESVTPP